MLNGNVLVLNHDYSPMLVCSVSRAFLLVFLQKAELLEQHENEFIRTVSTQYPLPAVIKINTYIHIPFKGVVLTRQNIFKRDKGACQYCGKNRSLTLDHVIPKSKGGKSTWNNLVAACSSCNSQKGDLSLEKSGMVLNRQPTKPSYLMYLRDAMGNKNKHWEKYLFPKEAALA